MDESLVHSHGGCEFEPRHCTSFFITVYFYLCINLCNCLNIIYNKFLIISVSGFPIELMHSVASRICVFVFANVPFKKHFV